MKKLELSAQKQWALEHYKGMENLFLPSYSPDFKDLDEEGIRHDVNNSIRHGFFSMLIIFNMIIRYFKHIFHDFRNSIKIFAKT